MDVQFGSKTVMLESGHLQDTSLTTIDTYLNELKSKQWEWAQIIPISERINLLEHVLMNIETHKDEWIAKDLIARHIPKGHWDEATSYFIGPSAFAYLLRIFILSLKDIQEYGIPKQNSKAAQVGNKVILQVYPTNLKERLLSLVSRAEIHLKPGSKVEALESYQAKYYKDKSYNGGISLILGAGNGSFLTPSDMIHKLVVEKKVTIVKIHPILEYLYDILGKIFKPLVDRGYVKFVLGGAKVGDYLTHHPLVQDIHMTGSDKTYTAIVNSGVNKPVTGELGNVTPVIVVPGKWKEEDFDYQADSILARLGTMNGYACCAARVLILPKNWDGSQKLLDKITEKLTQLESPINYYPGTDRTVKDAITCYPNMEMHGSFNENQQPWMFAKGLDPEKSEAAFQREFWSTFMSQTFIDAPTKEAYLQNAVQFANNKLWGTLTANIIIDPESQKELEQSNTLQNAIDNLQYGVVGINQDAASSIILGKTTWGGYQGVTFRDIQSGNCYVGNALMFDNIEKSVVYDPFTKTPRPFTFLTSKARLRGMKALSNFFISDSYFDLFKLILIAIRG